MNIMGFEMEHEAKNKSKSWNVMWNENQNRIKSKE